MNKCTFLENNDGFFVSCCTAERSVFLYAFSSTQKKAEKNAFFFLARKVGEKNKRFSLGRGKCIEKNASFTIDQEKNIFF